MRGRVAVLEAGSQTVSLEEFEVPSPEPGALVLAMQQAAICGSDLHVWRGDTSKMPATPAMMGFGHEGFGTVAALGPGTTTDDAGAPLRIGDRVIHHVIAPRNPRMQGGVANRQYGQAPYFISTFGDYYYVEPNRPVYRVPDALPDDVLAPVNCAMGAAINGLLTGKTGFGSNVVLFGAGGLGLTAAAAAKDMGASKVIVLDRIPARLELALEFGADHVINVDETDVDERVARVFEYTGGRGADVVLELVGLAGLLPEGIAMTGMGGTYVEVGLFYAGTSVAFDPSTILRGKTIVGSNGYPAALIPRILDFLVRNLDRRPFERMASHRFDLADINDALVQSDWTKGPSTVTRAVIQIGGR